MATSATSSESVELVWRLRSPILDRWSSFGFSAHIRILRFWSRNFPIHILYLVCVLHLSSYDLIASSTSSALTPLNLFSSFAYSSIVRSARLATQATSSGSVSLVRKLDHRPLRSFGDSTIIRSARSETRVSSAWLVRVLDHRSLRSFGGSARLLWIGVARLVTRLSSASLVRRLDYRPLRSFGDSGRLSWIGCGRLVTRPVLYYHRWRSFEN